MNRWCFGDLGGTPLRPLMLMAFQTYFHRLYFYVHILQNVGLLFVYPIQSLEVLAKSI